MVRIRKRRASFSRRNSIGA